MRRSPFILALLLTACGGNGVGPPPDNGTGTVPAQHVPEIGNIKLSPSNAEYLAGNGEVLVSVEFTFSDAGQDVQTLLVDMPDGTRLQFDATSDLAAGTVSKTVPISTGTVGTLPIQVGLVDKAGDRSNQLSANFEVFTDVWATQWTSRLSGLPFTLKDVVWNGNVFIAVGGSGAILRSADGINWVAIDSGTNADLGAVAADGPYVVAVGDEIILQSTDHGASWIVKDRPAEAVLEAVAINSPQVVVGGYRREWGTAVAMISEDRGETWRAVDSWPNENLHANDLLYRDGLFVASTISSVGQIAWVTTSADGNSWNDIAVSDELAVLNTIVHDGSQFVLAGWLGEVFASPDAFNWTQLQTPVRDVFYTSAAWNGSRLVLAGMSMCGGIWICYSSSDIPVGLSSTDGGVTWEIFNIDGDYGSRGLAWGNGRFVSVGEKPLIYGEGAIYTSD